MDVDDVIGSDHVDDIAATAEWLGGRVLIAPFDAGAVRLAVLADPQGAGLSGGGRESNPPGAWTAVSAGRRGDTIPFTQIGTSEISPD